MKTIKPSDSVLAAVSGGIDSVVLLDKLCRYSEKEPLRVSVAHVNHCLRGLESLRDEKFVRELAKKYGCKIYVKQNPPRPPFNKGGENLQNAARNLRYEFFLKTAKKIGANKIATAHHADDQAETMLLHLTRGAGLTGLGGMPEVRELKGGIKIVRPLLSFTKKELLAYAKERGLKYVEDRTNKTKKYHRNVIRREILPLLQKYNPNIIKHLCKTASILRDEDAVLRNIAETALKKASDAFLGDPQYIALKRPMLIKYDVAIIRRALRLAYAKLTGGTADLLTDHIDKMMWIISSGNKKGRYCLPKNIRFIRKGDLVELK